MDQQWNGKLRRAERTSDTAVFLSVRSKVTRTSGGKLSITSEYGGNLPIVAFIFLS